jgi:zona occludens toxin
MIVLITGTPGSGKTLFAVSKILELRKQHPEREIYSDIDGLNIDDVERAPEDWRTTPDGSVVIYDEAQQHERFRSGSTVNKDEIVQALQVHRHTGHDIYFITQSPRFLNAFVLDLVGEHYHLHRPYGASLASVYYWRSVRKQPQSQSSREVAENEFLFKYPKDLFQYYKSASQHNVKLKLPKKLFIIIAAILLIGLFVGKMIMSDGSKKMLNGELGAGNTPTKTTTQQSHSNQLIQQDATNLQNLDIECRKGINVEKPECVQWFNNLSKNGGSVNSNNSNQIAYNPNKPYDTKLSDNYMIQVNDVPKLSGCMTLSNGQLIGIDQQGNYMQDIVQSDCKLYMNGYRPFDYSKTTRTDSINTQIPQTTPPQQTEPSQPDGLIK